MKSNKETIISFLAAVLIITAAVAAMGIYPFGSLGIACADMKMQYLGLVREIYDGIKSHSSPFISYKGGLGINLFAASAGYITDPLNLLFLLFDSSAYQEVWLFIIIIKFGLIAASVSYCLKKSNYTQLSGALNIALSVLYALNGLNTKLMINPFWLNFSVLLPLTVLGIEKILLKNKPGLLLAVYSFTLLINLNFNAYISGIFAAICFVYYCIVFKAYKNKKNICKSFFMCAGVVALSIGLSAIAFFPTITNILSGYSDTFVSDITSSIIKWQPVDIIQCFMLLQNSSTANETLHGCVGIAPLILTFLLFVSDIPRREKIAAGIFVGFMIFSIMLRPLYIMWHAFREPTGFYGRFLYTVSYLFIMLSARCCKHIDKIGLKKLIYIVTILMFTAVCGIFKNISPLLMLNIFIDLILIVTYAFLIYAGKKRPGLIAVSLPAVFIAEAVFMCCGSLFFIKANDGIGPRNEYTDYIKKTSALRAHINDDDFYRMTDISTVNPSAEMLGGYNGIDVFSNQTNQKSLEVLSLLGIWSPYDYRSVNKYFNSIVSESLFNVKYILVTDKSKKITDENGKFCYVGSEGVSSFRISSDNYKLIYSDENGEIYQNKTAFPLMFAVQDDISDTDGFLLPHYALNYSACENLDHFTTRLLGGEKSLFEYLTPLQQEPQNAAVTKKDEYFSTLSPKAAAQEYPCVNYNLDIKKDGEYFIDQYFIYPEDAGFAFSVQALPVDCIFMEDQNFLSEDAGPFKKGDTLNFTIYASGDMTYVPPRMARLDEDAFNALFTAAQNNALKNIRENKNGDITASSDFENERLIFSSLSFDKGFHVYIDGRETKTVKIANAFLGYYVPAGSHDITIKYISPGFKAGVAVTAASAVLTLALLLFKRRSAKLFLRTKNI